MRDSHIHIHDPEPYHGQTFDEEIYYWFTVFRSARARQLILTLEYADKPLFLTEIAKTISSIEQQQPYEQVKRADRKSVRVNLLQGHLPRLKQAGIIDYQETAGALKLGDNFQRAIEHLETPVFSPTPREYHRSQIQKWHGVLREENRTDWFSAATPQPDAEPTTQEQGLKPHIGKTFDDLIEEWFRAFTIARSRLAILAIQCLEEEVTFKELVRTLASIGHRKVRNLLSYRDISRVQIDMTQVHIPRLIRLKILRAERPTVDPLTPGENLPQALELLGTAPISPTPTEYHCHQLQKWHGVNKEDDLD